MIDIKTQEAASAIQRVEESARTDALTQLLKVRGVLQERPKTAAVNAALAADKRDLVFADLCWALLNSKEFAFNH